jgi:hypothetical protein
MDAHFRHTVADRLAIAEVPEGRSAQPGEDMGLRFGVGKPGQPYLEFGRSEECVHSEAVVSKGIRDGKL